MFFIVELNCTEHKRSIDPFLYIRMEEIKTCHFLIINFTHLEGTKN